MKQNISWNTMKFRILLGVIAVSAIVKLGSSSASAQAEATTEMGVVVAMDNVREGVYTLYVKNSSNNCISIQVDELTYKNAYLGQDVEINNYNN